eukprot:SAG31_NODE_3825_length_3848_cov_1.551614_3_plen_263_part_00
MAEAMYRLAMHPPLKRPFQCDGALPPLTQFLRSEDRFVHRNAIMAVKELCENKQNRLDLFTRAPGILPTLFGMMSNIDPRVKRMAAMTLVSILEENENKIVMLEDGSLPRLVALMKSKDVQLRKCGVDCMQRITKLGDIHPPPLEQFERVRDEAVVSVIVDTFLSDTDTEIIMGLLKATTNIIGLIKDSDIKDRFVKLGAVAIMMWHADRLENARCAYCSDDVLEVVSTMQLHAAVVILPFIPFFYMLQEGDPGLLSRDVTH